MGIYISSSDFGDGNIRHRITDITVDGYVRREGRVKCLVFSIFHWDTVNPWDNDEAERANQEAAKCLLRLQVDYEGKVYQFKGIDYVVDPGYLLAPARWFNNWNRMYMHFESKEGDTVAFNVSHLILVAYKEGIVTLGYEPAARSNGWERKEGTGLIFDTVGNSVDPSNVPWPIRKIHYHTFEDAEGNAYYVTDSEYDLKERVRLWVSCGRDLDYQELPRDLARVSSRGPRIDPRIARRSKMIDHEAVDCGLIR